MPNIDWRVAPKRSQEYKALITICHYYSNIR